MAIAYLVFLRIMLFSYRGAGWDLWPLRRKVVYFFNSCYPWPWHQHAIRCILFDVNT